MTLSRLHCVKAGIIKGFAGGSDGKQSTYKVGHPGSIPGSGRSPGGGNGNPHQYSSLENPVDRGAWRATVNRATKSQTQLSHYHLHFQALLTTDCHQQDRAPEADCDLWHLPTGTSLISRVQIFPPQVQGSFQSLRFGPNCHKPRHYTLLLVTIAASLTYHENSRCFMGLGSCLFLFMHGKKSVSNRYTVINNRF